MNAETFGGLTEPLISSPQKGRRIEKDRGDQVCVGQTDAKAVKVPSLDHREILRPVLRAVIDARNLDGILDLVNGDVREKTNSRLPLMRPGRPR
jgi:hypothetical protein